MKVANLVLEDTNQPTLFGAATLKVLASLQGCQKGLLNQVFGPGGIAKAREGILEEVIAVLLYPTLFGAATLKVLASLQGCQKGLLNQVFGPGGIAKAREGILEEVIAVLLYP